MQKAVITDHSFETPDVETSILESLGCSVISQRAFTDQAALRSASSREAASDVSDPEPIDLGHPLMAMENVLITSHVPSVSEPSGRTPRPSVANTVAAAARGEALERRQRRERLTIRSRCPRSSNRPSPGAAWLEAVARGGRR